MADQVVMSEAMALVDKKVDMTLDELIKISRTNAKKSIKRRVSNRQGKFVDKVIQDKSSKVQRFMDSRSSLRQSALAQKRSNFNGNQFSMAHAAARISSSGPVWGKPFNRQFNVNEQRCRAIAFQRKVASGSAFTVKKPLQQVNRVLVQKVQNTLDTRFANMKDQRMKQNNNGSRMNFAMGQNNIRSRINFVSRQNNNGSRRRNGSGPNIVPWARNRI